MQNANNITSHNSAYKNMNRSMSSVVHVEFKPPLPKIHCKQALYMLYGWIFLIHIYYQLIIIAIPKMYSFDVAGRYCCWNDAFGVILIFRGIKSIEFIYTVKIIILWCWCWCRYNNLLFLEKLEIRLYKQNDGDKIYFPQFHWCKMK